jgi:ketosteroid isomerase-like protein
MTLEEMEARLTRIEDIEAIKQLGNSYAYFVDSGDWQGMVSLFTEDCFYDSGIGKYEGKAGITKFFRDDLPPAFSFTAHMVHNPTIKVNGNRATGQWYSQVSASHTPTKRALWILGQYNAECAKLGGKWKFKTFISKILYATPFDEGWVKTQMCL